MCESEVELYCAKIELENAIAVLSMKRRALDNEAIHAADALLEGKVSMIYLTLKNEVTELEARILGLHVRFKELSNAA
jgi:hypothetical protein